MQASSDRRSHVLPSDLSAILRDGVRFPLIRHRGTLIDCDIERELGWMVTNDVDRTNGEATTRHQAKKVSERQLPPHSLAKSVVAVVQVYAAVRVVKRLAIKRV